MRITLDEVARLAGVSKATVSRVLNNKPEGVGPQTRVKVQKILDDLNYSPANGYSKEKKMFSKSIGLVVPDISNPFFAELAKEVEKRARSAGYSVLFVNTDFSENNESKAMSHMLAKKVDGIILISARTKLLDVHKLPERYGVPCLLLDRKVPEMACVGAVLSDNEFAGFRSCELLINNGSSRIAFISGPKGISTSEERLEGYKTALKQYNIPFDKDLCKTGNYTVESGYNAVIELERANISYSAILASNDMMALGALKALGELARSVPDEVEVIGFDNILFSQYLDPPLTTVQQPTIEMGRCAVDMILKAIEGKELETECVRLQPRLLIRKTTKSNK